MSPEPTDVLFAAYLYPDPARLDFQAVLAAGVRIEGAVCVSRDHAGELHVEEQPHPARHDPELPRGGLGGFARLGLGDKFAEQAAETIPCDGAGVIVLYPRSSADALDKVLTRTVKKTVGEFDRKKVDALRKALAEEHEELTQRAAWAEGDAP